jgi:DNA processing protein
MVERFGSAAQAWDAALGLTGRSEALAAARDALSRAADCGARLLLLDDHVYPAPLRDLPDPPPALFAIGDLAMLEGPAVAVVGTRRATAYGERATREIVGALSRAGVMIVSGLARGIDGRAHSAALEALGRTTAVLGTGVDVAYPAAHRALHAEIAARGLLLSEELPGDRATGGSFPRRNRIIAALAQMTIVVEAPARSGALITAERALDLNRTVAAVPGPIDSPQSAGSNELLRDCATVIASVADALALAGVTPPLPRESTPGTPAERAVWDALGDGALDLDTLAARSALPARDCLAAVTTLELAGAIECALTGEIRRR